MKFKKVELTKGKQIDPYSGEIVNQGGSIVVTESHAQFMVEMGEGKILGDHPGPSKEEKKVEEKPVAEKAPEVKK